MIGSVAFAAILSLGAGACALPGDLGAADAASAEDPAPASPAPTPPAAPASSPAPAPAPPAPAPTPPAPPVTAPPTTAPPAPPAPPTTTAPAPPTPPSSGSFPNGATTGVPAGTQLTSSGTVVVTTDGAVISGLDVNGCIQVRASNVTIMNTRVRYAGGCANEIINLQSGTNLVVQDSELDGQRRSDCGETIGYANYTALRVDMHSCSDGPRLAYNATVVIRDSWIHDLSNLPGDHGDGIQCYGGRGPVTIQHNTIEGGSNAAFMSADGCSGSLLLDSNLFLGGGFTVRLYDHAATVTNNVFVRNTWSYGPVHTYSAPGAADPGVTIVAWSNNRIANNADGSGLAETVGQP